MALAIGALVLAGLLAVPAAPATASQPEGCLLFDPPSPVKPVPTVGGKSCGYFATHTGGYACFAQACRLVIIRGGVTVLDQTFTAGAVDPIQATIKPGDSVGAEVTLGHFAVGSADTT